ncbi:MAG: hypothetical protein C4523_14700 [Myxococcales bacterium]|nr:MAG: hypothetical protein C4523_14700 [Myxococcales bacterium]
MRKLVLAATLIVGTAAAFFGCEDRKAPSETAVACQEGQARCDSETQLFVCKSGAWTQAAQCPAPQRCDVESRACADYPPHPWNPEPVESLETIWSEAEARLAPPADWPACLILRRLLREQDQGEIGGPAAKELVPREARLALSEPERLGLARCVFATLMEQTAAIGRTPPTSERFANWEAADVVVREAGARLSLRARYQSPEMGERGVEKRPLATVDVEVRASGGAGPATGNQLRQVDAPDLDLQVFFGYEGVNPEQETQLRLAFVALVDRLGRAMGAFYRAAKYTDAWTLCASEGAGELMAKAFPGPAEQTELWRCDAGCRGALLENASVFASLARQPEPVPGRTPSPPSEIARRAPAILPGLVCLATAEQLVAAGRMNAALAPGRVLGQNRLLALWRASMSPDQYVRTLLFLMERSPEAFPPYLAGLAQADGPALRAAMQARAARGVDRTFIAAAPYWAARDRLAAVPALIEIYGRMKSRPDWQRELLLAIGQLPQPTSVPFLLKEIARPDAPVAVLRALLVNPQTAQEALKAALAALPRYAPAMASAVLDEIDKRLSGPKDAWPADLGKALSELQQTTRDVEILGRAATLTRRLADPAYRPPERPAQVDLFATSEENAVRLERALTSLDGLPDEIVLDLFVYRRIAPEFAHPRLRTLLVALAKERPIVKEVARRVARCADTPDAAQLAKDVLAELAKTASKRR